MELDWEKEYKLKQLVAMRDFERRQPDNGKYGAHLTHWSGKIMPINIDENALQALINYYGGKSCNTLYFKANNNGMLLFTQSAVDKSVTVTCTYNGGLTHEPVDVIPPGEFVMLLNLWQYVKCHDIRNSFINPNGSKEESL